MALQLQKTVAYFIPFLFIKYTKGLGFQFQMTPIINEVYQGYIKSSLNILINKQGVIAHKLHLGLLYRP